MLLLHRRWRLWFDREPDGHQFGVGTPWFALIVHENAQELFSRRRVTGFSILWSYDDKAQANESPWRGRYERLEYVDPPARFYESRA